jgi:hypothetical protein
MPNEVASTSSRTVKPGSWTRLGEVPMRFYERIRIREDCRVDSASDADILIDVVEGEEHLVAGPVRRPAGSIPCLSG